MTAYYPDVKFRVRQKMDISGKKVVTLKNITMYDCPCVSTTYKKSKALTSIPRNTTLDVTQKVENWANERGHYWLKVKYGNIEGWVYENDVTWTPFIYPEFPSSNFSW